MKFDNLRELYLSELKDLYNAEKQITKAMPKLIKSAYHDELKAALQQHLAVTEEQIARLEEIFDELGATPGNQRCKGMAGLIEEGESMVKDGQEPDVTDAAIIAAAQRVEHYEMAGYGTVREFAETLGFNRASQLLQRSLDEEKKADMTLTEIATSVVNREALNA